MKKILGLLLVTIVAFAYAGAPSTPTMYGPLRGECVLSNNIFSTSNSEGLHSTTKDTLQGADTIRLLNKYKMEQGWSYIAQLTDSAGAADTVKFMQYTYGSDGSTLMNTVAIDSICGADDVNGVNIQLTAGQSLMGSRLTLQAIKWIATLKTKIYRFELWRVRSQKVQ
jgi:hypothetical protein